MSTNPRDVVARIVDQGAWSGEGDLTWIARQARRDASLAKADTILSALQPAVTDEAVEAAARSLHWTGSITPEDARAALTAALPFMMGKTNG